MARVLFSLFKNSAISEPNVGWFKIYVRYKQAPAVCWCLNQFPGLIYPPERGDVNSNV